MTETYEASTGVRKDPGTKQHKESMGQLKKYVPVTDATSCIIRAFASSWAMNACNSGETFGSPIGSHVGFNCPPKSRQ